MIEMLLPAPYHRRPRGAAAGFATDYGNAQLAKETRVNPAASQRIKKLSTNQVGRRVCMRLRAICFRVSGRLPKVDGLLLSSTGLGLEKARGQRLTESPGNIVSLRMEGSTASLYRLAH